MQAIAIFRHSPTEGPGYFATFLDQRKIPWTLIKIDQGEAVPTDPAQFAGLVFMGGPMSVNDDLPWIAPTLGLIRAAVQADIPVMGHCLGGQLMAKALGGVVGKNPVKEIGWGEVTQLNSDQAAPWLKNLPTRFTAFHWHGETFTPPPQAVPILASAHCANQAYVLGKHLGMQCHVEMTRALIESWCVNGREEIEQSNSPAVQTPAQMAMGIDEKVSGLHEIAATLYTQWLKGVRT